MIRYFLLSCIFAVVMPNILTAQANVKVDSLRNELSKHAEDTNTVMLKNRISELLINNNPQESKKYSEEALELALRLNFKNGEAFAYSNLGTYFSLSGENPSALNEYFKALKIYEDLKLKQGIASTLGNIGIVYFSLPEYTKALTYQIRSLNIYEELNDKSGIQISFGNIANIYMNQSNYKGALDYYKKALAMSRDLGDTSGTAANLCNIGNAFFSMGDYPKAIENFFQSLKIDENDKDQNGIVTNYVNIGELYFKLSVDSVLKRVNVKNEYIGSSTELNFTRGVDYSLKAVKLSNDLGYLQGLVALYNNLYEAYKRVGDYRKSLDYHEKYQLIHDSVSNFEKNKSITALEAKRENQLKDKQLEIKELQLSRAEIQRKVMFGGMFLLIFFTILILRQRAKSERLLLNVLPNKIAVRLKRKENPIADHIDGAAILFADICNFTEISNRLGPERIVEELNIIYTKIDKLVDKHGMEKIKTIGDCYMAAAGVTDRSMNFAAQAAGLALDINRDFGNYVITGNIRIQFRIGLDCGDVMAGVIGEKKFIFDVWGDVVNTASRMEEFGEPGKIHCTERFRNTLVEANPVFQDEWRFEPRGGLVIKGKGMMLTWFLDFKEMDVEEKL